MLDSFEFLIDQKLSLSVGIVFSILFRWPIF